MKVMWAEERSFWTVIVPLLFIVNVAEQARAGHRRERNRDLQLGIIGPAGALEGVRPAVVEHIFALAMGLQIGRSGRDEMRRIVLNEDRRGGPAGSFADTFRNFERGEKSVTDERIVAGDPVPRRLVEPAYARSELGDDFGFTVGHRPPR